MISDVGYLAATDRRLSHAQKVVHAILCRHLDWMELRPVKLEWLAFLSVTKRNTAHKALQRLVELGYLVRGPKRCEPGGQCFITYRLSNPPTRMTDQRIPRGTPNAA